MKLTKEAYFENAAQKLCKKSEWGFFHVLENTSITPTTNHTGRINN